METDLFLNLFISLLFIILGIAMLFVKRNYILGFRTELTLSDPEIWSKTNKLSGILFSILGIISFILTFYSNLYVWVTVLGVGVIVNLVVGIIYSKSLAKRKKLKSVKVSLPKFFIIIMTVVSLSILALGIILPFTSPNPFIGIRIGETLKNPHLWKRVNTLSGIGFIIIGLVFSYIFYKDKGEGKAISDLFTKHFLFFTLSIILWSVISVVYAYLI